MQAISLITIAAAVCVLAFPAVSQAQSVDMGPITNPENRHRYYRLTPSSWVDAEALAQRLGGHLVTIDDHAENTWVTETFSPGIRSIWIGLRDVCAARCWEWSSGSANGYRHWASGEPNNIGSERYASIGPWRADYTWNNRRQDWQAYSVQGVVELEPCDADFNLDGGIDGADLHAFFESWEAGSFDADMNIDGGVDGADVSRFLEMWDMGC